jgi:hypothetical protein
MNAELKEQPPEVKPGKLIKLEDPMNKIEKVLMQGDLSALTAEERVSYYKRVCESLGLNALTKPFDYINLNGKLVLYATRSCTDQLRSLNKISIRIRERQEINGLYMVTAEATDPSGRLDEAVGAINIANLKGEALANAIMKAETKAKRRATLSICGLGFMDESEIEGAVAAPFANTQAHVVEAVRPQIENTDERKALIAKLEKVVEDWGIEGLSKEWKNSLTKEQRSLVGAQELQRIKTLAKEEVES